MLYRKEEVVMNFNIYIDEELGQKLENICQLTGKKRNTLIREALEAWLLQYPMREWPSSIQEWIGDPEVARFEFYRSELEEPLEKDMF